MTIPSGTHLGPYEILALIGEGGMGVVYRARDPRLGREVAIKVLQGGAVENPERLARFEREAQAASALNHPNILTIHDVGAQDGGPYLVTELLEGESLRELLDRGPLATNRALEIATQIARGLAAAHERGLVHRDLKPANIFLTRDGVVKILDFGLAKLKDPLGGNLSEASTMAAETADGVLLGTFGYMAPEQLRGEPADARADLFAFGCVLYELLSGRRAFQRDSAVETMSATLQEEPPELIDSGVSIEPQVERVLRHCLEKRAEDRFQSTQDLVFDLDPLNDWIGGRRVMFLVAAHRYSEAQAQAEQILEVSPESVFAKWVLGKVKAAMGDFDGALEALLSRQVGNPGKNFMVGVALALAGRADEAREVLDFLLERRQDRYVPGTMIAVIYGALGEPDAAFDWLDRAYEERDYFLVWLKVDPMYDPLRDDPRLATLLERMNFPP